MRPCTLQRALLHRVTVPRTVGSWHALSAPTVLWAALCDAVFLVPAGTTASMGRTLRLRACAPNVMGRYALDISGKALALT